MDFSLNALLPDLFVLPIGFGLGIFYFTCLWWTVKNLTRTQHPVMMIIGSGVARLLVALVGLYLIVGSHWERLLIAMVGFLIARSLLIARWRPQIALTELEE